MKNIKRVLFTLFFILIIAANVSAIGISPSKRTIDFQPNLETTLEYSAINNENKSKELEIYVKGGLEAFITPSETSLILQPNERKTFFVAIKLPSSIDKPGQNDNRVGVLEKEASSAQGETSIGSRVGVESLLFINIPYPGKYLALKLTINDAALGENLDFIIDIQNQGKEDLNSIRATIDIIGPEPNKEKITAVNTNEISLKTKEASQLRATLPSSSIGSGIYTAIATIYFDGETKQVEKEFRIGELTIEILDLSPNEIKKGETTTFNLTIQSIWNKRIDGIFYDLVINNDDIELLSDTSKTVSIEPWEKKVVSLVLDTSNLDIDNYRAKSTLYYSNKTTQKEINFNVEGIKISANFLLYAIIVAIILIFIILIFIVLRLRKVKRFEE
ncbi:MAG: hypothetical protein HYS32_03280 [Candidatus Woesearchaeota archaeon]|nr:MAG: hypothetical protein HYS32_03280 [Candidatus Woesearchaeota archaeon]